MQTLKNIITFALWPFLVTPGEARRAAKRRRSGLPPILKFFLGRGFNIFELREAKAWLFVMLAASLVVYTFYKALKGIR